jgi:hypothetical protein
MVSKNSRISEKRRVRNQKRISNIINDKKMKRESILANTLEGQINKNITYENNKTKVLEELKELFEIKNSYVIIDNSEYLQNYINPFYRFFIRN